MEKSKSIWSMISRLWTTSKETLEKEGRERAEEKFNLVQENGLSFIKFGHVKISPKKYGNATNELLETLYDLREQYVQQYVENDGRI